MMDEPETLGFSEMEPESYLAASRYRIKNRCMLCGKVYSYTTKLRTDDKRPCTKVPCVEARMKIAFEKEMANMRAMLESQTPPAQIGRGEVGIISKAIDTTAQIVMEDHKLTDLKDNVREGDILAPRLPPEQQMKADGFFSGEAVRQRNGLNAKQMQLIGRRAMAGAYRGMALNPNDVTGGRKGEPALRPVRTEILKTR